MEINSFLYIILIIVFWKSIILGSNFNFYYFIKYGKKYSNWYFNRETFNDYLEREE